MYVVNENQIIVVDVPGGFTGSISFLSNTLESPSGGYANVYDGPSGTGNVLGSAVLPVAPNWTFLTIHFDGTAKSVVFDSYPVYDDLTYMLSMGRRARRRKFPRETMIT